MDVEAALRHDARHVDAVEIDPAVVDISRRYNAGAPYSDPRVTIFVDDARAYLARAQPGYDLVIFGFLDSQALFSTMSNVRPVCRRRRGRAGAAPCQAVIDRS